MQPRKNFLQPEWVAAILITFVACALHFFYWLHVGGLWRDEVNLLNVSARQSISDMGKDSFPALMPLLIHGWTVAGLAGSDLHLRLIGLFEGLGILAALWIAGWKIRRAPPLVGLVLLGLNDTVIFFGDSLRAYGLGSVFAVALTASAFLFLQKPSLGRAAWLLLFAVLSVQSLYHNVVLVAAISFGVWAVCWRRKDGRSALRMLLIDIIAAATLSPYVSGLTTLVDTSTVLRTGVELRRFFWSYEDTLGYPLSGFTYVWALLAAIIVARAGVGLWQRFKSSGKTGDPVENDLKMDNDLSLFASITLVLAAIGFPLFFWRAQMPMQSWYVIPFMASAVVCFDAALPRFTGLIRAAYFGLAAGTALLSFHATSRIITRHFSDVDVYARILMRDAAPRDYIVVYPWTCGITFNHYFTAATPWQTVPPLSDHSVHRYDLMKQEMEMNTNALVPMFRQISRTLQSGHRVWVLTMEPGIVIPKPGTQALPALPSPPLKNLGWAEDPYSFVWASQMSHFIAAHSREYVEIRPPSSGFYITENVELLAARGWKTNLPAP